MSVSNVIPLDTLGNYRKPGPPQVAGHTITIETNDASVTPEFDGVTTQIPLDSGDLVIGFGPPESPKKDSKFEDNLAEHLNEMELANVAEKLLLGIEQDDQSRAAWLENLSSGIGLLGLEIKNPRGATAATATPAEGTSTVDSPLLLEAVLRFQANARGELLPSDGPVKIRNDGEANGLADRLSEALERDLNHYLTKVAKEYYPDTDRMLLMLGFGGIAFKKGYHDPIRQRPVIESIDAKDLIVSNAATAIDGAGRVTHRLMMRPSYVRRMQLLGVYRDFALPLPDLDPIKNAVDAKIDQIQGIAPPVYSDQNDQDRELYECYCELELPGFEHTVRGKETGLPLPYKVTLDKSARRILEIRRNWHEDDPLCLARNRIIAYTFVPGLGFYGIGLLNILGNATKAVTAAWRLMIDSGMYANFPGFLYLKTLAKQMTNQFRIPPGGGMPIDAVGGDIRASVMPLPYKDPSAVFIQLIDAVSQAAQRVGGTAELQVGEGRQDAPVGTTLAMIEQATKLVSAVHKRLHQAQGQEFDMLKSLLMEDPAALWRHNKKSEVLEMLVQEAGQGPVEQEEEAAEERHRELFLAALEDCELVPAADPNTSSQTERHLKIGAALQMAQQAGAQYINIPELLRRAFLQLGFDDVDTIVLPPPAPGAQQPNPDQTTANATLMAAQARMQDSQTRMAETQIKARQSLQDAQAKQQEQVMDAQTKAADLSAKERIANLGVAREMVIHNDTQAQAQADRANENMQKQADRAHDMQMAGVGHLHDQRMAGVDQQHQQQMAGLGQAFDMRSLLMQHQLAQRQAQTDHLRNQQMTMMQGGIANQQSYADHVHNIHATHAQHQTDLRLAAHNNMHQMAQKGVELQHESKENALDREHEHKMTKLLPKEAGVNGKAKPKKTSKE